MSESKTNKLLSRKTRTIDAWKVYAKWTQENSSSDATAEEPLLKNICMVGHPSFTPDGILKSNRKNKAFTPKEVVNGVEKGIHVYLKKPDPGWYRPANYAILKITCELDDLVAVGANEDHSGHAVFMKVKINPEDLEKYPLNVKRPAKTSKARKLQGNAKARSKKGR